jgi:hypothetical protein
MQLLDQDETLPDDSRDVCLCWSTFLGEYTFGKDLQYRFEQAIRILLFTSF